MKSNLRIFKQIVLILLIGYLLDHTWARTIDLTKRNINELESKSFEIKKCRQQCFLQTMDNFSSFGQFSSDENVKLCHENSNCYMCYDYCRALVVAEPDLSKSMCDDEIYCTKGCQIACTYHRIRTLDSLIYKLIDNS